MCVSHNCHIISGSKAVRGFQIRNCNYFIQTTQEERCPSTFCSKRRHVTYTRRAQNRQRPFARVSYGFSCSVSVSLLLSARHHLQYTCTHIYTRRAAPPGPAAPPPNAQAMPSPREAVPPSTHATSAVLRGESAGWKSGSSALFESSKSGSSVASRVACSAVRGRVDAVGSASERLHGCTAGARRR